MRAKKIYVASSWRNQHQQTVVTKLREWGYEVYDFKNPPNGKGFSWSEVSPDWQKWNLEEYRKGLDHSAAVRGFISDFNGMARADECLLLGPCGRSASIEAGWMAGAGKKVVVFLPEMQEPELMYNLCMGGLLISWAEFESHYKGGSHG